MINAIQTMSSAVARLQIYAKAAAPGRRTYTEHHYSGTGEVAWAEVSTPHRELGGAPRRHTYRAQDAHDARLAALFDPEAVLLLAQAITAAMDELRECEQINSRNPDNDGATRVMPHRSSALLSRLARRLMGEDVNV